MSNRIKAIFAVVLIFAFGLLRPMAASTGQTGQASAEKSDPERVLVGAYDAAHINGLVFITGNRDSIDQNFFGLRFVTYRQGTAMDDSPSQFEFGPQAADGSFARVSWQPQFDPKTSITLRWGRIGKYSVAGHLTASSNIRLAVESYRPWSGDRDNAAWAAFAAQSDRRTVFGEHIHNQKVKPPLNRMLLRTDRAALEVASFSDGKIARLATPKDSQGEQAKNASTALPGSRNVMTFDLSPNSTLGFIVVIGNEFDAMQLEAEKYLQRPIAETLDKSEREYDAIKTTSGGTLGEGLQTINRLVMWNRLYWPEQRHEYVTMHRHPQTGLRGDVIGWDSMMMSTMTALIDGSSAMSTLRIILAGQTPDGRVPLRRYLQVPPTGEPPVLAGRSMPPLGALCALKVYLATQDLAFLAWAYPRLQQWNDWWHSSRQDGKKWRDGNSDGLLEWGFDDEQEYGAVGAQMLKTADKQRLALAEAGVADREAKYNEQSHTLEISSVALNSLYALDTELLMSISREIGLTTEADRWQLRYDDIKRLVNDQLWSEEDGLYLDRDWNGKFSSRATLENLYPLVAGIPNEARAKRMLDSLRNMTEQTGVQTDAYPGISYLLYLGLKRYGFDAEAKELAAQNSKLARNAFDKDQDKRGKLSDLFVKNDQRKNGSLAPQQLSLAGLLYLPGIEELLSTDPWNGLTIGNPSAGEESRIERIRIAGGSLDVIIGPKRTVIRRDGNIEIEFEAPVRLKGYRGNDRALGFVVETKEPVRALVPASEGRKVNVSVNDKILGSTSPGAAASFKLKEGSSKVLIVR